MSLYLMTIFKSQSHISNLNKSKTHWCSSVLCHFGVKSKFKPESRTHTTELGKHFLNTLGRRVALKHWPAFAHRIPTQCQCAIRLQLTPESAGESEFVAFHLSRQGVHQGSPL